MVQFCKQGLPIFSQWPKRTSLKSIQDEILQAILTSQFVPILLENARNGTVWGLEAMSIILQSDFLTMGMLQPRSQCVMGSF